MDSVHLIGYLAGAVIAVSLAPQVYKSFKTKSTSDISFLWNSIYIFGLILFQIYGIGIKEMPIVIMNTIELILAISLITAKAIYK